MDDLANPYASPQPREADAASCSAEPSALNKRLMTAWAAVVVANVVVPLGFALLPTQSTGRWGILSAILVILICGWCFCCAFPVQGRKLVAGSVLTALSQLLPILQLIAGIIGLAIASSLGLFVGGNDGQTDHFVSEFGGFVATMSTGTILVVGAFMVGWLAAFVLPKHWFRALPVQNNPV